VVAAVAVGLEAAELVAVVAPTDRVADRGGGQIDVQRDRDGVLLEECVRCRVTAPRGGASTR
jgi:hypothetical protein